MKVWNQNTQEESSAKPEKDIRDLEETHQATSVEGQEEQSTQLDRYTSQISIKKHSDKRAVSEGRARPHAYHSTSEGAGLLNKIEQKSTIWSARNCQGTI